MPDADICGRCGSDLSIAQRAQRAQRQAQALVRHAVRALLSGNEQHVSSCAGAATHLSESPLAQAVIRTIQKLSG